MANGRGARAVDENRKRLLKPARTGSREVFIGGQGM